MVYILDKDIIKYDVKMPEVVFKYRSSNSQNIDALMKNMLYVPRTDYLNDVSELSLYSTDNYVEIFEKFISLLRKGSYILSLGTESNNMILWNLYSDSFKGFIIEYQFEDLISCIKKQREGCRCGYVTYSNNKKFISSSFLDQYKQVQNDNCTIDFNSYSFMFNKSSSWKVENEFRMAFPVQDSDIEFINVNNSIIYKKGFFIKDIRPNRIVIGYKMELVTKNNILKFCKNNNIVLEVAKPNLSSRKYDIFFKSIYCPI